MTMKVVLIGNGLFDILKPVLEKEELSVYKVVNTPNYGNFRTLTVLIDINETELINKRTALLKEVEKIGIVSPLFPHGNPTIIYIFKNLPR